MKNKRADIVKITLLFSAIAVVVFSLYFNLSEDRSGKISERESLGEASVLRFDANDGEKIKEKGLFKEATLGDTKIRVEIVESRADRTRGLSGRPSIGMADGMLFVFPTEGRHGIWMKEMRFSIDILWLDSSGRVVYIKEDASPVTFPEIFKPDRSAKFVLEVESGKVSREGWKVGDRFIFQ